MPKRKIPAWPPLLAALTIHAVVSAADPVPHRVPSDGETHRDATRRAPLENVVVTASRVAVPIEQVGSSVTIVDRDTLEARQSTFVADALRDVPGVAVSRGGGYGAVTQARIRGAEGNHTLVLIDGIEANNPVSNSEFDFANLPAADVERIEILRGPQSAIYGSDAIGGVINVITRRRGPGFDAHFTAEGGDLGTHAATFSAGGGTERATGGVHVARLVTDGENISRFGGEKDGFESESLRLHGRVLVADAFTLQADVQRLDSRQAFDSQDFEFPATPTQGLVVDDDVTSRLEQRFARIEANAAFARALHRLGISGTQTTNTFFDDGAFTGSNDGDKTKLDYQATIELGAGGRGAPGIDHALTLALERELVDYANRGATADAAENQNRDDEQTSVIAEYRRAFERAGLSVSGRRDENQLFDDAHTYRINGTYALDERTRVRASLGTGVTNPGFYELFGFFPGSFAGNPDLRPEHSTSFDVGIERALGDARIDVTYFRADLEDEIVTLFDSTTFLTSVDNLPGESERRGVELAFSAAPLQRWQLAASYTYTDARQSDGAAELRRPRHAASLDNTLDFLGGRARLNVGIDYTGRQLDNELVFATAEDRVALPSFMLVDVSGSFSVTPRIQLYARVQNALDERYEEWFSYRGRGRSWVAGFRASLGQ